MKYKMLLTMLVLCGSLYAADVFENFESYADTAALRAASWVYTPAAYGSDPNSPDAGRAVLSLNTTDAHGGSKCLSTYVGSYDVNFRDWGFKAPNSSQPWNWSAYKVLRFYYKGDVNVRVRIHNQYIPGIVFEQTYSNPATDEWIPVVIDMSNISRTQVQLVIMTVYDRNGQGATVMFDDFDLLTQPMFDGPVNVYYPGVPTQSTLSWKLTDPNAVPLLKYGIGGYDNQVAVSGSLNFSHTIDNLIPSKNYLYRIEAAGFTKEGKFAAEALALDTLILENYESYADDAALRASSLTYGPASYGCVTTSYLETGSYDGSKAVRFEFKAGYGTSVTGGVKLNGAYLMGYDKLRIWYKGAATNPISGTNPREVRFRVQDAAGIFAEINAGKVVANNYWNYVEFPIDNSASSRWNHVTYIIARIDRPAYETLNFYFDRIEVIRELDKPAGDIDGDYAVNDVDLGMIVSDWLTDNTAVAGASSMLEDFESGISDWSLYYNSTAPSTITALTSGAAEGSGGLKWDYDVTTSVGLVYAEILYALDTPVNLSQYDRVNIKVKRYLTNSDESSVYIKFLDGGLTNANLSGKTYLPGDTIASNEQWQIWSIDLHNLNYSDGGTTYTKLSDITNVRGIMFGVIGNAGTGTIEMDAIELATTPECSAAIDTDLNGDCVVNLLDYAIVASNWLAGYTE